jgi:hypothetical protein
MLWFFVAAQRQSTQMPVLRDRGVIALRNRDDLAAKDEEQRHSADVVIESES